ncbi:carbohydrate ABC transporter permease [Paenibacillus paeoniae]|uniref:Carbohydrate ABC transporter permease n=1 Tax=Paenibacillus paeoniae TaxID=2292705 RepID=A0A371PJC0_9BACL|nr:carbohydrate ABC transporter permease [Paenibacillus paeoniae]REK75867.1 carbohydrate ABC transporter permease [Paenibacillus paeoniae]
MNESRKARYIANLIGIFVALIALFPLIWMTISGFKKREEVLSFPFRFFPKEWNFQNYVDIIMNSTSFFPDGASFMTSMFVTFGVAVFCVIFSLLLNSMAAYVFARLEFPFKKFLWLYYMLTMFIPGIAIYITGFMIVDMLNMTNTFWVLTLPGLAYVWSVFFVRQFYLNIPMALEEAALLDGATRFRIYWSIFLPLSVPPFVIMGMNVFLGYWSAFLWPVMTISDPSLYQINQLLMFFKAQRNTEWQYIMAGASIASVPPIVLMLMFQKYIIQGIKLSGIK